MEIIRQVAVALLLLSFSSLIAALPTAASLNLCADSLLLEVAAPRQIVSVSWLATDPSLSNYPEQARRYPNNRGRIEDLVTYKPDYVFTGANTSPIDNALLQRLGYKVIRLRADNKLEDYQQNLLLVGRLLKRDARAKSLLANLRHELAQISANQQEETIAQAVIFQANGYSPGIRSLPVELLRLAGLDYLEQAATEWPNGRFLSVEELIYQRPAIIILASLQLKHPSLADLYLNHRALTMSQSEVLRHWKPVIANIRERHLNCGSQFIIEAVQAINQARSRFLSRLDQ